MAKTAWRRNARLGPYNEGAGVHEISAGFVAQIRFDATRKREMLRSQNRQDQIGVRIIIFFLRIGSHSQRIVFIIKDAKKCFECSESRN